MAVLCYAGAGSKAGIGYPSSSRASTAAAPNGVCDVSMMQSRQRLVSDRRISEVHRNGRTVANGFLVMRVLPNGLDHNRFCFIAGKRVGKAVVRNRVKRRLREVVRQANAASGWDTILIARRGTGDATYAQLEKSVHNLMRRARISNSGGETAAVPDRREFSQR